MSGDLPPRDLDFRAARIGAGLALTFATIALLILDALSVDYDLSPVHLGFLLVAIGGMFSVDIGEGLMSLWRK